MSPRRRLNLKRARQRAPYGLVRPGGRCPRIWLRRLSALMEQVDGRYRPQVHVRGAFDEDLSVELEIVGRSAGGP